jgi:CMP/dCMP kinase
VRKQQQLLQEGDWVAEGRDVGTVVCPDAAVKVFLTASPEVRAQRRAEELGVDLETVLAEQSERDARDREREHGALRPAEDSVELDTTGLDVGEVVARVVELARERGLA